LNVLWNEPSGLIANLGSDELHIWRADLRSSTTDSDALSGQERARAEKFLSAPARRRYIASHLGLRGILAGYLQTSPAAIQFTQPENRKPFLANRAGVRTVSFSLSRSEDLCLVAVASHTDVGVDIECVHRGRFEAGMADQVFTPEERAALEAFPPAERLRAFLLGWTRKEAYAKCIGLGLSADLTHAEVGLKGDAALVQGVIVASLIPQEGFLAAWAARDALRPSFWNWTF
jgi:4'-phosphopantetheinyl transferase